MTYRVLVTDDVDAEGVALLTAEAELQVEVMPTLPKAELLDAHCRLRCNRWTQCNSHL